MTSSKPTSSLQCFNASRPKIQGTRRKISFGSSRDMTQGRAPDTLHPSTVTLVPLLVRGRAQGTVFGRARGGNTVGPWDVGFLLWLQGLLWQVFLLFLSLSSLPFPPILATSKPWSLDPLPRSIKPSGVQTGRGERTMSALTGRCGSSPWLPALIGW
jgi:hypothetical protein